MTETIEMEVSELVDIPFNEWSRKRLDTGRKRATARTSQYGEAGDLFEVDLELYLIVHITKLPVRVIAKHFYGMEGAASPEEFVRVWEDIHPGRGYEPDWEVWFHIFCPVAALPVNGDSQATLATFEEGVNNDE